MTSAPTVFPSDAPSSSPITSIPSTHPTITGEVASVIISGRVDEALSEDTVDDITSEIANIYGVDENDVNVAVDYVISGAFNVTIPLELSENEASTILEQFIGDALGVHSSKINVVIDEDGAVQYTITGKSHDEVESLLNNTLKTTFISDLNDLIIDSGIVIDSTRSTETVNVIISGILHFIAYLFFDEPLWILQMLKVFQIQVRQSPTSHTHTICLRHQRKVN